MPKFFQKTFKVWHDSRIRWSIADGRGGQCSRPFVSDSNPDRAKNSLVKQYQKLFEFEDVELEFTTAALGAIADLALKRGTGARGLRSILEEILLDTMYELPSRTDIAKVIMDVENVLQKTKPQVVPRAPNRVARPRRAAS